MANHGFGQGVGVTPIQLAVAYAAIANGGYLVRPYVVKAAYDAAGRPLLTHTPEALHRVISPGVAHTMNRLLQGVVNGPDGTGQLARVNDFRGGRQDRHCADGESHDRRVTTRAAWWRRSSAFCPPTIRAW